MCAALLGLMLECSTRILPAGIVYPGSLIGEQRDGQLGAFHAGIDVAGPGDFDLLEALDRPDAADDLFGDLAGRLAKLLGEFKGERHRVLAQFHFRRLLDHDFRQVEVIGAAQKFAHLLGETAFERTVQEVPLSH